MVLTTRKLNSLVSVQPPVNAIPSQRLTVLPCVVRLHERLVAGLLHPVADLVDRGFPGDVLPVIGAGPADLRLGEPPRVEDVLLERGALGAERAAVDRMVRVALDVDHLRGDVLGLVAQRVDDHAAAHGAVGAGGTGLGGARDLQLAHLGVGGGEVEAEDRGADTSDSAEFQEVPAGEIHRPASSLVRDGRVGGPWRAARRDDLTTSLPQGQGRLQVHPMNPRSGVANRPRLGSTSGRSLAATPNQRARVAEYSSTEVVGIQRPSPASLGPSTARVGSWP